MAGVRTIKGVEQIISINGIVLFVLSDSNNTPLIFRGKSGTIQEGLIYVDGIRAKLAAQIKWKNIPPETKVTLQKMGYTVQPQRQSAKDEEEKGSPAQAMPTFLELYKKQENIGVFGIIGRGFRAFGMILYSFFTTLSLKAYRHWQRVERPILKLEIPKDQFNTVDAYRRNLGTPKHVHEANLLSSKAIHAGQKKIIYTDWPQFFNYTYYQARQKANINEPLALPEINFILRNKQESLNNTTKLCKPGKK